MHQPPSVASVLLRPQARQAQQLSHMHLSKILGFDMVKLSSHYQGPADITGAIAQIKYLRKLTVI